MKAAIRPKLTLAGAKKLLRIVLGVTVALAIAGCSSSPIDLPHFTGDTFWANSVDHIDLLALAEPDRTWSIASLWIPLAEGPEQHGMTHLLEHLLLRRLRQHGRNFFFDAGSSEHWIYFNCAHLPAHLPQALSALQHVFEPQIAAPEELDRVMAVLAHEKALHPEASMPTDVNLAQRLHRLHHRYLVSDRALLIVVSPYPRRRVIAEVKRYFPATGTRRNFFLPPTPWHRPAALAESPEQLLLIGPPLAPGQLPYFKLLPAWIDRHLAATSRLTWTIDWQITPDQTLLAFRARSTATDCRQWAEDLTQALRTLLAEPPPAKDFVAMQAQLLRRYYLAMANPEHKIFVLGKAYRSGYLADVLSYPRLLQKADRHLLYQWVRQYLAAARSNGDRFPRWRKICEGIGRIPPPPIPANTDFSYFPSYQGATTADFYPKGVITLRIPQQQWAAIAWHFPVADRCFALSTADDSNTTELAWLCRHQLQRIGGKPIYYHDAEQVIVGAIVARPDCRRLVDELSISLRSPQQRLFIDHRPRQSAPARLFYRLQRRLSPAADDRQQSAKVFSSKANPICLVAGDFLSSDLAKWGRNLQQALADNKPSALPPDPNYPKPNLEITGERRYVMAGVKLKVLPKLRFSEYHTLALYLNDLIYRHVILPGHAYQAHAFYHPMQKMGILGLWLATTPDQVPRLRRIINEMLIKSAWKPIDSEQFAILKQRAYLYFLRRHDQTPQALLPVIRLLAANYRPDRTKFQMRYIWQNSDLNAFTRMCQHYLAPAQWTWAISN